MDELSDLLNIKVKVNIVFLPRRANGGRISISTFNSEILMIPAANSSIQIGSTNHHDTIDWFTQNIQLALPYGPAVTQPSWLDALDSAAGYTVMLVGMGVCGYVGMWDGMKLGMPSGHKSHHGGWMDTVKNAEAMSVGDSD